MADENYKWAGKDEAVSDPANSAKPIVPSDTEDLPNGAPKAIYTGSGGEIAMVGWSNGDDPVLWEFVQPGQILPFRPRRVLATQTTCTGMLALY